MFDQVIPYTPVCQETTIEILKSGSESKAADAMIDRQYINEDFIHRIYSHYKRKWKKIMEALRLTLSSQNINDTTIRHGNVVFMQNHRCRIFRPKGEHITCPSPHVLNFVT